MDIKVQHYKVILKKINKLIEYMETNNVKFTKHIVSNIPGTTEHESAQSEHDFNILKSIVKELKAERLQGRHLSKEYGGAILKRGMVVSNIVYDALCYTHSDFLVIYWDGILY